jgi:TetR/AcrR family transcriptional repressor of nem operon
MRPKLLHSPARERLLEHAQDLMLTKGFVATTVDEICKAAGLSKGTFFHYFKNKEELGKATLDRFFRSQLEMVGRGSFRKKADPLERLYGWVDSVIEASKTPMARKGCLVGNFSQELSDTHPEIRSECAQRFSEWTALLKKELDEAKARYLSRSSLDTQGLAEHFIAVLQGSLILAKAKQDFGTVEKNLGHFKRYLKMVFEK